MIWPCEQPAIATDELLLSPLEAVDADDVYRACQDPLIQHFTQVPVPYGLQDAESFISGSAEGYRAQRMAAFAVRLAADRRLLGAVSIMDVDWSARSAEVGYWTAPWARGRGLTTRAVILATDWALGQGGLVRLVAEAEGVNDASGLVLERAGFRRLTAERVIKLKGSSRILASWEKVAG